MSSPLTYPVVVDDKDLDDAALWAMIDSASASHSSKCKALVTAKFPTRQPPSPISNPSAPLSKFRKILRDSGDSGEVVHDPWPYRPPRKAPRLCASEESSPLALIRSVQRTPPPKGFSSPDAQELSCYTAVSPGYSMRNEAEEKESGMGHGLLGMFPSVSLFKEYQNAAMAILEKNDYTLISGNPFIKKSGWRKISCYFNISYEIRDKNIEFDENRNVQRAEFVIRAHMQGGRFSDGWGSCDRREKRFQKPNHDVPSTAETRAKNKACQDLLGIGEYRPGATNQFH
ncbi:unnamed protein product [Sphenostylis stenocarpa]|uniref:Uncharacterized protein n=1 Tax=Sphenostylis stenocarpa TaxID=92480 RepID=A0AA86VV90_9FABA|nr:unnamed protein product [Sphenostylis stenocarpa]